MKTRTVLLASLLAGCADAPTATTEPAALLSDTCHYGGDPDTPWFAPGTNVDVWISTIPELSPMTATGLSQALFQNAVRQALNVWNEESGASIRLRLRGFTDDEHVFGALMITGRTDLCDEKKAIALPELDPFSGKILLSTTVELRQGSGADGDCGPIHWATTPPDGTGTTDVVAFLIHEIGHAVFNLAEVGVPDGEPPDPNCADFGQETVMRPLSRVLSSWDLEMVQRRTGARGPLGRFHWTEMSGPTSWFPVSEAVGMDGIQPLFRPGSMSTAMPDPWFGWVQSVDDGVQRGGGGRADVNRWRNGSDSWTLHTGPDETFGRPVAVASSTSGELLLAYQTVAEDDAPYTTRQGQVCWRTSDNDGASWSPPTCPDEPTPELPNPFDPPPLNAKAGGYGLTATYDPATDVFLIGYVLNPDGRDLYTVTLLTVPSAKNAITPPRLTLLPHASTHAPGLACRGDGECRLAVKQLNDWGTVGTGTFTIDAGSGAAVAVSPLADSPLPIYDTPSLVFVPGDVPADDSYRLAYAADSAAIYTYRMDANGGPWMGTGDVFNDADANVSSPVLTVLPDAEGRSFAHAWFVRYW